MGKDWYDDDNENCCGCSDEECCVSGGMVTTLLLCPPAWPAVALALAFGTVALVGFGVFGGMYYGTKAIVKCCKNKNKEN